MIKTYAELMKLTTFEERYKYLQLKGSIGKDTFGFDRYLNQMLYTSKEWKRCRREVIIRDDGCDLGCKGLDIHGRILIHHIDPITVADIVDGNPKVFSPENLIVTSHNTHNAIHYGNESLIIQAPIERRKNDTCLWAR